MARHGRLQNQIERVALWGPPAQLSHWLGLRRSLFELFHDLIQIVARGVLEWRERLIGLEFLEPHVLADGQQVPVVYVSRDRPGERAAEPEIRLFLARPTPSRMDRV